MPTRDRIWRLAECWLSRRLPTRSLDGVLRDLEDDYRTRVSASGSVAAVIWLWREARSLAQAYGQVRLSQPDQRGHSMHARLARFIGGAGEDARFALRSLRHSPGFSATVVLTLGLGIGLCTSLFTVFNALALRTWDVRDPASIVVPFARPVGARGFQNAVLFDEFEYLRQRSQSLDIVGWERGSASLEPGAGTDAVHVQILGVSPGFFDVLGVAMAQGRAVVASDDAPDAPGIAGVISHGLWLSAFGGNAGVLGRVVRVGVERVPVTIVGVARRGFAGLGPAVQIDLFVPGAHLARLDRPGVSQRHVQLAGRLQPGRSRAEAAAELDALHLQFRSSAGLEASGFVLAGTRPASQPGRIDDLLPMFGSIGAGLLLVLLLACANVGNLQLARWLGRRAEIAVRLSLGASRGRVVRQLLTEALGLASVAGGLGLLLAWGLPGVVLRIAGEDEEMSLAPDGTVLSFALGLAAVATLLFALAPALRTTTGGGVALVNMRARIDRRSGRLRALLLASQVALSLTLLTGAGLLTRGLVQANRADFGFDVHGTTLARVTMPADARTRTAIDAFAPRLEAALRASSLGPVGLLGSAPPLSGSPFIASVRKPGENDQWNRRAFDRPMSAAAFDVLGLTFVAGGPYADAAAGREAVINETLAAILFPGEPLADLSGRVVMAEPAVANATFEPYTIAGIVRDSRFTSLTDAEAVFHRPAVIRSQSLLVFRNQPDAPGRLRALLDEVQPGATVTVTPVAAEIERAIRFQRTGARLAWAIGGLGLALATVGVFGVFAYFVEERRREIGIRLALGAGVREILRAMFAAHRWSVGAGLAAGLVLSVGAGFVLRGYLFGLSPLDPVAYLGVTAILIVAATLATIVPSRRAWRVDPAVTLRTE